jgi:hypothetical protein
LAALLDAHHPLLLGHVGRSLASAVAPTAAAGRA